MPLKPKHEQAPDEILRLFAERGDSLYGGESVTQTEHALQCAYLAEREGSPASLITAALLHDVGHLLHSHGGDCAVRGVDDRHEELGAAWLRTRFGPIVYEPIRMHVLAKRFLCSVDRSYFERLSPASQLSLRLQGDRLTAEEVAEFRENKFGKAAVQLRRWDDAAKIPGLQTPALDHFLKYVARTWQDTA